MIIPHQATTKRQQLTDAAHKFMLEHEDENGLLSKEDQAVFDAILAGAHSFPLDSNERSFKTQAELDRMPPTFNPFGSGAKLVDRESGKVIRGLLPSESFASAVRQMRGGGAFGGDKVTQAVDTGELSFGSYLRAIVEGPRTDAEFAALSGSSGSAGYNVPEYLSAQVIDAFRPRSVMMQAGAQTVPLNSNTHSFVRLLEDAQAGWRNENGPIAQSDPTFGAIVFRPRSLAVIVRCSRELLQDGLNVEETLRRSFAQAFAAEVDRAGLVGVGAGPEPTGLAHEVGVAELSSTGAITSYGDVLDAYKTLLDNNAGEPTAFIISNREWRAYAGLSETTTGQPLHRPPAIADLPFLATSSMPTDLGNGGDESVAFLGDFSDFVFGFRSELQVDVLRELYAEEHQVGFVAHLRVDTAALRPQSFVKLTGITAE